MGILLDQYWYFKYWQKLEDASNQKKKKTTYRVVVIGGEKGPEERGNLTKK